MEKDHQIIDFHTHLGDVCSGCYPRKAVPSRLGFVTPNLLEKTSHNKILTQVIGSPFFPKSPLISSAVTSASFGNSSNLIAEIKSNGVAKAVISPIEPFVSTSEVASECQRYPDQLVGLMSVNFAKFTVQQIQEAIRTQSKLRHCPGIKFHPNLQGVHPHSEKAQALFDTAEKEKMFVLVHGGITPIVYGDERRFSVSETLIAALKPFPSLKVIVAHVGSYFRTDDDFVEKVLQMPNIMVDTSGVSPDVILHALEILGPERVIYGSDWPYGTMRYSLKFVREAVTKYCSGNKNDCETVLARILSKNAEALLS